MSNALPNPLVEVHRQAEAEFQAYGELEVVSTFGEPQAEYAAVRKGAALFDAPHRGLIELRGKDRLAFLNNLLTNETFDKQAKAGLAGERGVYAFFLNPKGRILTDLNVLELGDRTLLELEARLVQPTRAALDRYLFADNVTLAGQLGVLHQVAVHGPGAREVLNKVLSAPLPAEMAPLASVAARVYDTDAVVWRDDPAGVPGYHLILPVAAARAVWMNLIAGFGAADRAGKRAMRPIGWAVFNACRIEAGRPLYGIDFDDSVLPAETGQLGWAVSLTKGCYVGQEIVARMHARQQVARQLVGLRVDGEALPVAGAKLLDAAGNEVGGVTSSTVSPVLSNAAIALGYVKRAFVAAGSRVRVPAEGAVHDATVVELPFIKP